jgi:GldM C-terminal domain
MLLFMPLLTNAQLRLINPRLFNPDSAYLYVGIDNILQVAGYDNKGSLQIKTTKTLVQRGRGENEFILRPVSRGTDTVRLYKQGRCILTKVYQVNYIPGPIVSIGKNNSNYLLTVEEILTDPSLYIVLPGCHIDARFAVFSFDVIFVRVNTDTIMPQRTEGNRMGAGLVNIIKTLAAGDKIIFDNIKVTGPDSHTRTILPVAITIH